MTCLHSVQKYYYTTAFFVQQAHIEHSYMQSGEDARGSSVNKIQSWPLDTFPPSLPYLNSSRLEAKFFSGHTQRQDWCYYSGTTFLSAIPPQVLLAGVTILSNMYLHEKKFKQMNCDYPVLWSHGFGSATLPHPYTGESHKGSRVHPCSDLE